MRVAAMSAQISYSRPRFQDFMDAPVSSDCSGFSVADADCARVDRVTPSRCALDCRAAISPGNAGRQNGAEPVTSRCQPTSSCGVSVEIVAILADCSCGVIHASPPRKAPASTDASRGSWAAQREEKAAEGGKRRAARATFPAEVTGSVKGRPRVNGVGVMQPS